MIQIIMLIIGIVVLFMKSVSVTSTSELRRPNIVTFGVTTVIITLIAMVASYVGQGIVPEVLFWIGIIVPIIMAITLREPKKPATEA